MADAMAVRNETRKVVSYGEDDLRRAGGWVAEKAAVAARVLPKGKSLDRSIADGLEKHRESGGGPGVAPGDIAASLRGAFRGPDIGGALSAVGRRIRDGAPVRIYQEIHVVDPTPRKIGTDLRPANEIAIRLGVNLRDVGFAAQAAAQPTAHQKACLQVMEAAFLGQHTSARVNKGAIEIVVPYVGALVDQKSVEQAIARAIREHPGDYAGIQQLRIVATPTR